MAGKKGVELFLSLPLDLVGDTPLFGLHGYESLNRVWFSGSGIFLLFCTTSL